MKGYFGTRISDHMIQTRHGYLVCTDVPIARTGIQEYTPEEIGVDGNEMVPVLRHPDQVLDARTLASFEGNSITLNHPPQDLDASNDAAYAKGHIQNIRVGGELDAEGNQYLLADLIVKDANLIEQIRNGDLREVSCGYTYRLEPTADGKLQQVDIRGNHLAIVPKGRAGREASIQDHAPEPRKRREPMSKFKQILSIGLKKFAQDAEPEDIADAMKECADAVSETEKKDEPAQVAEPEKTVDADPNAEILTAIKELAERVAKLEQPKAEDAEPEDEDEDEAIEADDAESELEAGDEGVILPESDRPQNPIPGADRKVGDALKVMAKAIAASGDKRAIDAYNSLLPKKAGKTKDGYKLIATRKVGDQAPDDAATDFAAKAKALHRKTK